MNRAQKRAEQREMNKKKKAIEKLSPEQIAVIDALATQKLNREMEAALVTYQRVINASLAEQGLNNKRIDAIWDMATKLLDEETIKSKKLNEEITRSGDVEMAKKKIEEAVLNEIAKLMDEGKKRKEIIESVLYKFPNMSKAMIINAYQQVKEEMEENVEPEIAEALDYIFRDEEEKEVKKDESNESEKKLKEKAEIIIETAKEMQCSTKKEIKEESTMRNKEVKGLKIKSMVVEGSNGTYKVCEEGVELTKDGLAMHFQNIDQLDEFMAEFKEVFSMVK